MATSLRDKVEDVLVAWNAHEISVGAPPVIDYDCRHSKGEVGKLNGRVHAYQELLRLKAEATDALADRIDCHLAYLGALLGERMSLNEFVRRTQGVEVAAWSGEYVTWRGEQARKAMADLGIPWGARTRRDLLDSEENLTASEVPEALRAAAAKFEPLVRKVTGTTAPYNLTIETADADAYWSYWLDGEGQNARLRLNMRNARFTDVQARQFSLHEILGHALQSASYSARCCVEDVPWVRILSVHANHQVLLEGLAQALPLFVAPDDEALIAHLRLDYYLQLVSAELHLAINDGASVSDCLDHAKLRAPFLPEETVGRMLSDRSTDVLLRSYQWAYPAGADWFIKLAETADSQTISDVLHAAYRSPLTPQDLGRYAAAME
ncbi:flavohemoglobin expression-modulating QEGLA motif protein [Kibdelosporangium philippinense]|uniref:Flavohemoglobin expression-modulating QEGLA motif protein n=1 Tax=Kibdelosporangium philippinense TaxID=211113 RepID=A0ABS8Z246_9PSEU|nr:flavohemoglobin expression-modulating QEGLA motif protein [Kibdelosporangium philippinense]MCE7001532.1 flavohemoglobin expression-modulating QEGLA motif protein [Kibdelosporangium philippinense]